MASSSASSSRCCRYDVFPSFSGEDVRKSFLSHLFRELDRKSILSHLFRELDRKSINTFIDHGIERSCTTVNLLPLRNCTSRRYLKGMELKKWCQLNTKRREFLDAVPRSLIDLVDKCLTVNPSLRISAEDALKHDFFHPVHETLRKQRLLIPEAAASNASRPNAKLI